MLCYFFFLLLASELLKLLISTWGFKFNIAVCFRFFKFFIGYYAHNVSESLFTVISVLQLFCDLLMKDPWMIQIVYFLPVLLNLLTNKKVKFQRFNRKLWIEQVYVTSF